MADVQYAKNHFEVFSSVTDQLTALYSFTGWPLMTPAVFMLEIFAYSIRSLHLTEIQFRFWITKVLTGYNYRTGSLLYRVFFKTVLIHLDCIQDKLYSEVDCYDKRFYTMLYKSIHKYKDITVVAYHTIKLKKSDNILHWI